MTIHDLPEKDIMYVAGQPMPRIVDDGNDIQHYFTMLRDATFTFGEQTDKYPDVVLKAGDTLTGYYDVDALGSICIDSNEKAALTMPVEWVKIEPLCETCKKRVGAYEVAGMRLCSQCIAPPVEVLQS